MGEALLGNMWPFLQLFSPRWSPSLWNKPDNCRTWASTAVHTLIKWDSHSVIMISVKIRARDLSSAATGQLSFWTQTAKCLHDSSSHSLCRQRQVTARLCSPWTSRAGLSRQGSSAVGRPADYPGPPLSVPLSPILFVAQCSFFPGVSSAQRWPEGIWPHCPRERKPLHFGTPGRWLSIRPGQHLFL